jgi:hypothetical protein
VLTRILTQGPIPRVEIARRTGLSQAAVTKAVAPLIETGFVTDQPVAVPGDDARAELGIGRPVSPLTVVPDSISVIGLKVTPSDLIGVTTDFRAGIRAVRHQPVTDRSPNAVLKRLVELAKQLIETLDDPLDPAGPLIGIGVAVSGDVDARGGVVRDSPFMGWREVPVAALSWSS